MPTSQYQQIPKVLDCIVALQPRSILDIGVGFGKYGFLCREYLEIWGENKEYGKFERKIDGIEVFEKYLTPVHSYIYDQIYLGDAREVIETIETSYDTILLLDVLEHFPKNEGQELLEKLLKKNKSVVVSAPKDIGHQEDVFDNVHETHHAQWTKNDFRKIAKTFFIRDAESIICVLTVDKSFSRSFRKTYWVQKLKKYSFYSPLIRKVLKLFLRKYN